MGNNVCFLGNYYIQDIYITLECLPTLNLIGMLF